jgi:hypothetical protein
LLFLVLIFTSVLSLFRTGPTHRCLGGEKLFFPETERCLPWILLQRSHLEVEGERGIRLCCSFISAVRNLFWALGAKEREKLCGPHKNNTYIF